MNSHCKYIKSTRTCKRSQSESDRTICAGKMFSLSDVLTLCDSPEVFLLINFSETCSGNKCFICLCGVNTASTLQEYGTHVQHFPAATPVTVTIFFFLAYFQITSAVI